VLTNLKTFIFSFSILSLFLSSSLFFFLYLSLSRLPNLKYFQTFFYCSFCLFSLFVSSSFLCLAHSCSSFIYLFHLSIHSSGLKEIRENKSTQTHKATCGVVCLFVCLSSLSTKSFPQSH
jgi:hypothetical protein